MSKLSAAARLLREISTDPLVQHKPTLSQTAYLKRSKPFAMLTGANRSGKSQTICYEMAATICGIEEFRPYYFGGDYLAVGPTRKQVAGIFKKFLMEESKALGPAGRFGFLHKAMTAGEIDIGWVQGAKPQTPAYIKNKRTGKTIHFTWSSAGRASEFAQGFSFDGIWITETGGNQALLDELFPRILDTYANPEKPGGGFLTWDVTETKINAAMAEFRKKAQDPQLTQYEYFYLRADENPTIDMATRDEFSEGMSERAKRIRIYGTGTAEGEVLIYPQLLTDPKKWERKTPYVWHGDENLFVSYDAGVDHPTAILFACINRLMPRKLRLIGAIEDIRTTTAEDARRIRQFLQGRKMTAFVYDHQGASRTEKGSGLSTIQQLLQCLDDPDLWHTGDPVILRGKSQRAHGINAVRTYFDPTPDISTEPLIEYDPPTFENGLGRWLEEMQAYRGREDLDFTGPKGVYNKNDDLCDTTRYLCAAGFEYTDYGPNTIGRVAMRPDVDPTIMVPETHESPEEFIARQRRAMSAKLYEMHAKKRQRRHKVVY